MVAPCLSGSLLGFDSAKYGDIDFDKRFRICQSLLKSDTRNKSVQNQSCIIIIFVVLFSGHLAFRESIIMSPHLRVLLWLPVKQFIKFKWCLLIFKTLKFGLLPYFSPYFVPYTCKISTMAGLGNE